MAAQSSLLLVTAAALTKKDGRVLVQQRSAHRSMAGLWEFPGGKIESGESPEQALARELAEELGIIVPQDELVPASFASAPLGERQLLLLLYLVRRWEGEPQPLDSAGLRWVTVEEMQGLPMPPADVPLVAALAKLMQPA